jgi:hypothetical protein
VTEDRLKMLNFGGVHTKKNIIFTNETRNVTAYILLGNSHHVGNNDKNTKLGPQHPSLCLEIPLISLIFLASLYSVVLMEQYLTTEDCSM